MLQPSDIPDIRPGERISASFLNKLAARARLQTLLPGMFVNGAMLVQAPPKRGTTTATTDGSTRYGRVVANIPAATNCRSAGWGIAEDAVSLLSEDTGEEVDPDHPITVTNKTRQAYVIGCMVELRGSLVINGDCFPAPSEFWDEIES